MIVTNDLVYVHMPKTGGTFVTHALTELHKTYPDKYGRLREIKPKHGTCHDIPEGQRHKTVLSTIRNPFDWYVSQYEFAWWKRTFEYPPETSPTPVGAAIERALAGFQERHKHFPDLSFGEFIELCVESADVYNSELGSDIGLYSHGVLRFYFRDPAGAAVALADVLGVNRQCPAMFDVDFIATDRVGEQLCNYLVERGYEAGDVEFIRGLGRILPMGRGRHEGQPWEDYYDEALMSLVMKMDKVGFGIYERATSRALQHQTGL